MSETNPTPAPKTPEPSGSGPQSGKRPRILIAESDGFTRMVLMLLFRMLGFAVDFTSNGTIALGKLRGHSPDALLVELKLSGLSGLDLIRKARHDARFRNTPIYVFTRADLMKRAVRKEVQASVTKLFDKRSVSRENLVKGVLADLAEIAARQQSQVKMLERPVVVAPTVVLQPGELDELIDGVCKQSEELLKSRGAEERAENCNELLGRVSSLVSCAEAAGLRNLARQAKALERLLDQLSKGRQKIADATLRTVSRAVEVLGLLSSGQPVQEKSLAQFRAAIIDESPAASKSIGEALVGAGFNAIAFENPGRALQHLAANPVDLVVLNVRLPELHGVDLDKIRKLPLQATTPVIFVSEPSASDHSNEVLPSRTQLAETNPLLLIELVMKALNEVQSKAAPQEPPALAAPAPAPATQEPVKPGAMVNAGTNATPETFAWPVTNVPGRFAHASADVPMAAARESGSADAVLGSPSSQPASKVAGKTSVRGDGKPTILFVEDDPFALRVYKKALKREGFQVEVAEDGMAALDWLPRLEPDLVVLDLMLPELPGLEVLKFIRAEGNLKDTPVIVLSNAYMDALGAKAKQAGANRGLSKTECTPAKLVEQVCELLGRPKPTGVVEAPIDQLKPLVAANDADLAAETAIWTRQAGLRKEAPKEVAKIRQVCLTYIKAVDPEKSLEYLMDLYRRVRFLSAHAALIGFTKIAEVSSALEGLLFEIVFKLSQPTSSTFQTIAQAVDLLDQLVQANDTTFVEPRTKQKVLVVDDDAVCNYGLVNALKRGNFEVAGVQDPVESLRMLNTDHFDLVLLDINMPHLDGFEVCEQLRRMPQYKSIPVVFITVNAEFRNRARSVVCGGNDLIAKPVSPLELILKVTMHLLKSSDQAVSAPSSAPEVAEGQEAPREPNLSWSVEDILNKEETAARAEQAVPVSAGPPEAAPELVMAASLPGEPLQNAEALPMVAENQAEPSSGVVEESITERTVDEPGVEVMQPNVFVSDTPSRVDLNQVPEARTAESEWAGEAVKETAGTVSSAQAESPTTAYQPPSPSAPDSIQATPECRDNRDQQLEALQGECAKQREALEKYNKERETLVNRIYTSENDVHRMQARLKRRTETIESLQKQLDELKASQVSPETSQRLKELQEELSRRTGEFERTREELERQGKDRQAAESDLRGQLEAAAAAAKQSEAAHQQAQARCAGLEQELVALRQAREELDTKFAKEHETSAESGNRINELEEQLRQSAAEAAGARTELEKRAKEREAIELDLRRQLEVASAAAKQSEANQQQTQVRCAGLEQELAGLRQSREELDTKFAKEHQASAESGNRVRELEAQLNQQAAGLASARTELEKLAQERGAEESDLRQQLQAAAAAAKKSEAARQELQGRCTALEKDMAGLRHAREELNTAFFKAQQASTESWHRVKELEELLRRRAADLESSRTALEKQAKEHESVESDLRRQLQTVGAAAKQSEMALQQTQKRHASLEQELAGLRQAQEQLNAKVVREQQVNAESGDRLKALEDQLSQRAAELERARTASEKQAKEHARAESKLRAELENTTAAAEQDKATHQQTQARCGQLEHEVEALRKTEEALNRKCAKEQGGTARAAKRAKDLEHQLQQSGADLERAKADLEEQTAAHGRVESELRTQLDAAGAAHSQAQWQVAQLEQELTGLRQAGEELNRKVAEAQQANAAASTALSQAQARVAQLEQEMTGLGEVHEELTRRFAEEQRVSAAASQRVKELESDLSAKTTEAQRARGDLEKQAQAYGRVESDLRAQLEAAGAAHMQAQSRVAQVEQELADRQQLHEELAHRLAKEQQVGAAASQRVKELESGLSAKSAELEQAKSNLEKQTAAHGRVESDLRAQLDAAGAAHRQAQWSVAQLEQELAGLRQAHEELTGRFVGEQQANAQATQRVKALESDLTARTTECEGARSELKNQAEAHGRVESDLRAQLGAAGTALSEAQSRAAQLEQGVAGLQQVHEELTGRLAREQRANMEFAQRVKDLEKRLESEEAEHKAHTSELEQRVSQGVTALTRATADLARERGERERSEERAAALDVRLQELHEELSRLIQTQRAGQERLTSLQAQLRDREETIAQKTADFEQQQAERRLAEEQLQKARELNAQLRKNLAFFEEANKVFNVTRQDLESRLEATLGSLRESNARLQNEAAERQRQAAVLDGVQRDLQNQSRKRESLEAELRTALQGLQEMRPKLQQESTERQRLATTLDAVQRDLQSQSQKRETLATELQTTVEALRANEAKLQQEAAERHRLATTLDAVQRDLQNRSQQRAAVEAELQTTLQTLRANEAKLQQEAAERQRLATMLDGVQREVQDQNRKRQALEAELQATAQAFQASESRAQQETAERQRVNEALESVQLNLRDHSQRAELELSSLQSSLRLEQVERKRQETQIVRMRHFTLNAARRARLVRNTVRKQIREPVDRLQRSARSLLQSEMGDQQKRLAEEILQNVLLVHARLREPEVAQGNSSEPAPVSGNGEGKTNGQ